MALHSLRGMTNRPLILVALEDRCLPSYTVQNLLPCDPCQSISADSINATGQVAGGYEFITEDGWFRGVRWSADGTPEWLYTGTGDSFARGINDAGDVAGSINRWFNTYEHAVLFHGPGEYTDLGTLGRTISYANGVNNADQVIGSYATLDGTFHAFEWQDGVMTDLGTLGGTTSHAIGINNVGQVVGSAETADGTSHAFLYCDGVMTDLGTLGGATSRASGVNDRGQVVGSAETADGSSHAFLYSDGVMTDLGTLGGATSGASGINNRGQIVGWAQTTDGASHAFLYNDGVMTDLNDLLPPDGDWTLIGASGINDAGQIVGSSPIGDQYNAYRLTPDGSSNSHGRATFVLPVTTDSLLAHEAASPLDGGFHRRELGFLEPALWEWVDTQQHVNFAGARESLSLVLPHTHSGELLYLTQELQAPDGMGGLKVPIAGPLPG